MEKYRWSEEIFDDLRSNIIAALYLSREQNDEEVCRFIEKEVEEYSRKNLLTLKEREQLEHLLFNSLRKYDAIQELLEDPEVTEIMINGASRIFYEKKGKIEKCADAQRLPEKIAGVEIVKIEVEMPVRFPVFEIYRKEKIVGYVMMEI